MEACLTTRVPGSTSGIESASADLKRFSDEQRLETTSVWPFYLALDELLSNTVRCGYADAGAGHEIELRFRLQGDVLELRVEDDGAPFDPLTAAEPDTRTSLEERPVGGLGIMLVRKLMDEVVYAREHGKNVLTMRKRIDR